MFQFLQLSLMPLVITQLVDALPSSSSASAAAAAAETANLAIPGEKYPAVLTVADA